MFTGLIETTGTITALKRRGTGLLISVQPRLQPFTVAIGDSVAIDGACLTAESIHDGIITVTAVSETLSKTTTGALRTGSIVNMERALLVCDRLDGHLVLGHVDGIATIASDRRDGEGLVRTISVPTELCKYLAYKGSVAIDGISLTIAASNSNSITIAIIPHSLKMTNLIDKKPGDHVNIEVDVLARYVAHRLDYSAGVQREPSGSQKGGGQSAGQANGQANGLADRMKELGF